MVKIGGKTITHIYQGDNLIINGSSNTIDIKLGNKPVNFAYQGNKLIYPNPIKEGLVLWYDFKSMNNSSKSKDISDDLSGNKNDGSLNNFLYNNLSGYDNGLNFEGIDDFISTSVPLNSNSTISITLNVGSKTNNYIFSSSNIYVYLSKNNKNLNFAILNTDKRQEMFEISEFFKDKVETDLNLTIVTDSNNKKMSIYMNGELISDFEMQKEMKNDITINNIGSWNNRIFFNGKIYDFLLYDRLLTLEEIQHNYKIEKERWGL